jgi:hypothetical protein
MMVGEVLKLLGHLRPRSDSDTISFSSATDHEPTPKKKE